MTLACTSFASFTPSKEVGVLKRTDAGRLLVRGRQSVEVPGSSRSWRSVTVERQWPQALLALRRGLDQLAGRPVDDRRRR